MSENLSLPINITTQSVSNSSGNSLEIDISENASSSYKLIFPANNTLGALINDGNGNLVWKVVNIVINSIADLMNLDTDIYSTVYLTGFYEKNDSEQGIFYYNSSSSLAHDGGMVISKLAPIPTSRSLLSSYLQYTAVSNGRWIRASKSNIVPIEWYGEINPSESMDASVPINKAINSIHTTNKVIYLNSGLYTLFNFINFVSTTNNRTLKGCGDSTVIVCSKTVNLTLLLNIQPGCNKITLKNFKLKAWNYPSEGEPGWSSYYQYNSDGRYRFAAGVATLAPIGGFEEATPLNTSDAATNILFPPHTYTHSTIELLVIGTVVSFPTSFTIPIINGQINDIITTITATNTPSDWNTNTYSTLVRVVTTSSTSKGGFTNLPPTSNSLHPDGFSSSSGAKATISCFIKYNYNNTFTLTFKFKSAVDLSALTNSSYYNGTTYTLPLVLNIYKRCYDLDINNVSMDGMYFTGSDQIGFSNAITLQAVNNIIVQNCTIKNFSNDGISMKEQFDSWGPTIQTNANNNFVTVRNCTYNNFGTSGIDFEGDNLLIENNKFTNVWGNGGIRLGSRAFGTIIKNIIVRNNIIGFGSINTSQGNITMRCLGQSMIKTVSIADCTFFNTFSTFENIQICTAGNDSNVDNLIIERCLFQRPWRAIQIGTPLKSLKVNDCIFCDFYANAVGKTIIHTSIAGFPKKVDINNCVVERIDGINILLSNITTTIPDYSPIIECRNLILNATTLYASSIINFKYMLRTTVNNLHSINNNVNLMIESFTAAALPPVAAYNIILVTGDTNGSPTTILAYNNGINWKRIDNDVTIPS